MSEHLRLVLRNCWSCEHNKVVGGGYFTHDCKKWTDAVGDWMVGVGIDMSFMPPRDADGCPGWAPKRIGDGPSVPLWARWRARRVQVRPWASVTLQGAHGPCLADILSIGRGWVSVRVERASGPVGEIWPPELVRWDDAVLLPECTGIEVKAADGRVFRVGADEVDRVWAGVRWALENGAVVEGLRNI